MSGSFYATQTSPVDLGDGNTVIVRKLTYGELTDILSAAAKHGGEIDGVLFTRMQTEAAVISWSGPGFEGREVSKVNIRALPVPVGRKIAAAVSELNKDVENAEGN